MISTINAGEATCVYELYTINGTPNTSPQKEKVTIKYTDSKLTFSWNVDTRTRRTAVFLNGSSDINAVRTFDGTLSCPKNIYFGLETSSAGAKYIFSFSKNALNAYGSPIANPIDSAASSVSNTPTTPEDPNNTSNNETTCQYLNNNTLVFNEKNKTVNVYLNSTEYKNCSNSNANHLFSKIQELNYTCPSRICVSKNNAGPYGEVCATSLNEAGAPNTSCYSLSKGKTNTTNNSGGDDQANLPSPQVPTCETFKVFTDPIWFWLRIIGPTLALVLGVLDLLKAVASGDNKSVAKSYSDFGKRLGLAALLLLLPTVLNLLIGIIGFGDYTACF